ncbi:hypothetical protein [Breoghania sp.]|uniref:hypothetical protein n=1 Tax=Breoghania sp. TaxID=2065378 RepID=UPI0026166DE3|nr:hypothetical protein [Breoghania sp.]MDJ0932693.1 hypothetical protein [Breoghania sp.]
MMPILPVVRAPRVDDAIDMAVELEHSNRHTAMMHSTNVRKLTKMAKLIQTTIFVKNGPSYAGIGVGGEGHTTFTIAGPTGEGLTSARSFARNRKKRRGQGSRQTMMNIRIINAPHRKVLQILQRRCRRTDAPTFKTTRSARWGWCSRTSPTSSTSPISR